MATNHGRIGAFDVQWQILSNARVLWPIVEGLNKDQNADIRDTPHFDLIVKGTGTSFAAQVIWQKESNDNSDNIIFVQSNQTGSAEKAVEMLLQVTMAMINKYAYQNIFREENAEMRQISNCGSFYQPTG